MIAKRYVGKKLQADTLQIASEARQRKQENINTINATIGTLADEQGKFYSYKTIDKIIKNFESEHLYNYSPTDGGNEFKEAVLKWVFRDYEDEILKHFYYQVVATCGGTGAISNAITSSLDSYQTLLLPNLHWGPYTNMALANNSNIKIYQMFKDNKFDLIGFESAIDEIAKKEEKVTFILNDPCHNPTGYTLSHEEFIEIINIINNRPNIFFSFIYDIAYLDYSILDNDVRKKFLLFNKLKNNVIINIAFSCSKSFSIYGLRTGAQIILSKRKKIVNEFYDCSMYLSRTRWSNTPRAGINMLIKIVNDKNLLAQFLEEQKKAVSLLKSRAEIFIREATDNQLPFYPYHGGFFITIPSNNHELFNALKKENIFVIPLQNAIRVSISSIPKKDIIILPKKIKNIIDRIHG